MGRERPAPGLSQLMTTLPHGTTMNAGRVIGRRQLLVHAGSGALGIAVLGLIACGPNRGTRDADQRGLRGSAAGLSWSRVDLAYVSAYVLMRGAEAALVDAGLSTSADRIGE